MDGKIPWIFGIKYNYGFRITSLKFKNRFPDLGPDILGGGSVGPVVRVGDVGDDTTHREGVGRIPSHVGPQADWEATLEKEGRIVGIPPTGGRDGGYGTAGGGDLVSHRHNTVAQFIATMTIMELCLEAEQIPGPMVSKQWC